MHRPPSLRDKKKIALRPCLDCAPGLWEAPVENQLTREGQRGLLALSSSLSQEDPEGAQASHAIDRTPLADRSRCLPQAGRGRRPAASLRASAGLG